MDLTESKPNRRKKCPDCSKYMHRNAMNCHGETDYHCKCGMIVVTKHGKIVNKYRGMSPRQAFIEKSGKELMQGFRPLLRKEMLRYKKKFGWTWEDTWLWLVLDLKLEIAMAGANIEHENFLKQKKKW